MRIQIVAVAMCLGACQSSSDVTVTGKVASPAVLARAGLSAAAAASVPDSVVAFPLEKGLILSDGVGRTVTSALGADGSFSLTLPADSGWMLVLEDSAATGPDRFLGYVAATVGPGDTLLALPLDGASAETIALGTVSKPAGGDTYASPDAVPASDFSLTPSALTALARADAAFKNLKNLLVNLQGNVYTMVTPQFGFEPDPAGPRARQAAGVFGNPDDYVLQDFWGIQFDTNDPAMTIGLVCGGTLLELALPTGEVRDSGGSTCSGAAPARTASGPTFFGGEKTDPGAYGSHMAFGFGQFSGPVAEGSWTLAASSATRGVFDVAIAAPVDGAGRPTGLVPVVRANADASHRVTSFDVRWYAPDGAGGWTEVTDASVFHHMLRHVEIDVRGPGEQRVEHVVLDPESQSSFAPSLPWYVGGGDPSLHADRVALYVGNAGVGRVFLAPFE